MQGLPPSRRQQTRILVSDFHNRTRQTANRTILSQTKGEGCHVFYNSTYSKHFRCSVFFTRRFFNLGGYPSRGHQLASERSSYHHRNSATHPCDSIECYSIEPRTECSQQCPGGSKLRPTTGSTAKLISRSSDPCESWAKYSNCRVFWAGGYCAKRSHHCNRGTEQSR